MGYSMLDGLICIQNSRVIYQGLPVAFPADLNGEDLNEAFEVIIKAFSVLSQARVVG